MSFQPLDTDIFGQPLPHNIPEFQHLCRAVELSGEGETQLLLGPLPGKPGAYYAVRRLVSVDDETAEIRVDGTRLEHVGNSFQEALNKLNPHWASLAVTFLAPHLRGEMPPQPERQDAQEGSVRLTSGRLVCRARRPKALPPSFP